MNERLKTYNNEKIVTKAIVLGGGGSFGIAWETGYLRGLADYGIDTRFADLVVGTSAGSQVGTLVASRTAWDDTWQRLIDSVYQPKEKNPSSNIGSLFSKYDEIAASSKTSKEWIQRLGKLAIESKTMTEDEHLSQIITRIDGIKWAKTLRIAVIDLDASQRIAFGSQSGINLDRAVSASCSLPGVWPPTTIGSKQYFDGGGHSMENADMAEGIDKVLILSLGLPVQTPFRLEDQVQRLKESGSKVEVVYPSKKVYVALEQLGGNPVDHRIRPIIAACAREQGHEDAERIACFWNKA